MKTDVMNKLKKYYLILFLLIGIIASSQEKYPKETIYIKFIENSINKKIMDWRSIYNENTNGIFFKIGKHPNGMALLYKYKDHSDTLCISKLKNYTFEEGINSIQEKETKWLKNKFNGMTPYSSKNGVFNTYLVEIISDKQFVIYPVEWVGEGVIE